MTRTLDKGKAGSRSHEVTDRHAELFAKFFRGLGDPTRVKIVQLLLDRPHNVTELVGMLGSPQGRVSSHLAALRWCGLVDGIRDGRNIVYRVSDKRVDVLLRAAQQLLETNAEKMTVSLHDADNHR